MAVPVRHPRGVKRARPPLLAQPAGRARRRAVWERLPDRLGIALSRPAARRRPTPPSPGGAARPRSRPAWAPPGSPTRCCAPTPTCRTSWSESPSNAWSRTAAPERRSEHRPGGRQHALRAAVAAHSRRGRAVAAAGLRRSRRRARAGGQRGPSRRRPRATSVVGGLLVAALPGQRRRPGETRRSPSRPGRLAAEHAHGLRIIDQVADTVTLDRRPCGTTVTATFTVSSLG